MIILCLYIYILNYTIIYNYHIITVVIKTSKNTHCACNKTRTIIMMMIVITNNNNNNNVWKNIETIELRRRRRDNNNNI